MSTKQWFHSFIYRVLSLKARTTQVFTLALVSGLMAQAGVVVGYYQGSNAGSVPLKNLVTNGSAAELNYLIYAFEEPNADGSCTIQDLAAATQTKAGESLSLRPSEYLARNVRVSTLLDDPVERWIARYPQLQDCYCYSSDFPHTEGRPYSLDRFYERVAPLGDEILEKFFVTNAELLLP